MADNSPGAATLAIEAERRRQIEQEGWSPEHDDKHADGELMGAAMCYYLHAVGKLTYSDPYWHEDLPALRAGRYVRPMGWPWEPFWWKPKSPRRDLERSGALMLAERERRQRAGLPFAHIDHKLALVTAALARFLQAEAQP